MSEPERDENAADKVVATGVKPAHVRLQFVLNALMFLGWGCKQSGLRMI